MPPTVVPPLLDRYGSEAGLTLWGLLAHRAAVEPFNLVATLFFFAAILHTFLAPRILTFSRRLVSDHESRLTAGQGSGHPYLAEILHFFGEVEAVFGIWAVPLLVLLAASKGRGTAEEFISRRVDFTEPAFVVVIMTIASTRPVLDLAERALGRVADFGQRSPFAWWLSILTLGPLAGSFITEPGAMSICALLLARQIFDLEPRSAFRYATLGLLFVNVSVGGTLTHFAAPPVVMVASRWGWGPAFMFRHFGLKALTGIALSNLVYAVAFRRDFRDLAVKALARSGHGPGAVVRAPVPAWVAAVHVLFLAFTVLTAHTPALFIGALLFFLAFTEATAPVQNTINLRPPLLVGFFLGGLVIHGTLQGWWLEPVLSRLDATTLMLGATFLTSFNDNAAITYLVSLVPGFGDAAKYAVMAGAVTGGGLTVIANAPNPAGQSILARYFDGAVSPVGLFLAAAFPTLLVGLCFVLIP